MSGIPSWARVGAKVVCVQGSQPRPNSTYDLRSTMPIVGEVYTLRHVMATPKGAGVWLEEIVNPIGNPAKGWNGETGFHLSCFRPVKTIEDDIATHFEALLRAPQLEDAQ